MIKFLGCRSIDIKTLHHNVEHFRTQPKDYPADELFITDDENYLILCHTIREGSNGAYYTQIVVFDNNESQSIRMNLHNSWSPLWMQNFYYLRNSQEIITSLTCYNSKSKDNPTPTLIVNLTMKMLALLPKNIFYHTLDENRKNDLKWRIDDGNLDLCNEFRLEYPL